MNNESINRNQWDLQKSQIKHERSCMNIKCTRNMHTPAMKFAWRTALFHVKSGFVHLCEKWRTQLFCAYPSFEGPWSGDGKIKIWIVGGTVNCRPHPSSCHNGSHESSIKY